mmetsp:Transcript_43253/g.94676  ORF Transcript_43253/g.94676 Transcript_43253/m.94676 type:complete len:200 (+) Transcript_43253:216-815(+)
MASWAGARPRGNGRDTALTDVSPRRSADLQRSCDARVIERKEGVISRDVSQTRLRPSTAPVFQRSAPDLLGLPSRGSVKGTILPRAGRTHAGRMASHCKTDSSRWITLSSLQTLWCQLTTTPRARTSTRFKVIVGLNAAVCATATSSTLERMATVMMRASRAAKMRTTTWRSGARRHRAGPRRRARRTRRTRRRAGVLT